MRDDWLDLRVPIWVTDIGFLPRSSSNLVVTTTGYHQVKYRRIFIAMHRNMYVCAESS